MLIRKLPGCEDQHGNVHWYAARPQTIPYRQYRYSLPAEEICREYCMSVALR